MKGSASCLTDRVAGDSQNRPAISQNRSDINTIKSFISEKKERSKRHLNLIIHNVPESAAAEGPARKQHDIEYLTSVFENILTLHRIYTKPFDLVRGDLNHNG